MISTTEHTGTTGNLSAEYPGLAEIAGDVGLLGALDVLGALGAFGGDGSVVIVW
jgi:hypothetical protein